MVARVTKQKKTDSISPQFSGKKELQRRYGSQAICTICEMKYTVRVVTRTCCADCATRLYGQIEQAESKPPENVPKNPYSVGAVIKCRQCGKEFKIEAMSQKYCPACRSARKRQRRRSVDICPLCLREYTVRDSRQKYCPECAEEKIRQYRAKYYLQHKRDLVEKSKKREKAKRDSSLHTHKCILCGRVFTSAQSRRNRCPECIAAIKANRSERIQTGVTRQVGSYAICPICNQTFRVNSGKHTYCSNCAQVGQRNQTIEYQRLHKERLAEIRRQNREAAKNATGNAE